MAEIFDWLQPVPFWETGVTAKGEDLLRPVLLEFRSDSFMDDFLAEAASETKTDRANLKARIIAPTGKPLRLYQPAHARYYLICASLCCRQPGFPDREVRRAEGESVFFVLRRVHEKREYAWTVQGEKKSWQPVEKTALAPHEERLPLFSTVPSNGGSLVYGYIPVASRDTYVQRVAVADPDPAPEHARRMAHFEENILRSLDNFGQIKATAPRLQELQEQISLFLLLDIADFFQSYLPSLYQSLKGEIVSLTPAETDLRDYLKTLKVEETNAGERAGDVALKQVIDAQATIENLEAGAALPLHLKILPSTWSSSILRSKVQAALLATNAPPAETAREEHLPKLTARNGEQFLLRCVYERPCDPPFPPRLRISEATHPFDMATFFDTEAPARQIRIDMPADVSIAAIRKFRKGVGFVLSNAMRNKMDMVTGQNILKGDDPNNEGSWSLGMLCTFSLQIIFICAFILLLIIAFLLNIVFWWMPFFRICLPIPKKGQG